MYYMLQGTKMQGFGRDKFLQVLKDNGLLVKKRRCSRAPGTDSADTKQVYHNLKAKIEVSRCKEVIESDMTAIKVQDGYKPLSLCMDIYSRKILGWHLGKNWSTAETAKALVEASEDGLDGSIHHSDRGSQYGSELYGTLELLFGIQGSMSRKGTPTDAAHIERLNRTLKWEFNLRRRFSSFEEAKETIYCAVVIYNELRPHWSLNLKTPSQVYAEGRL